MRRTALAYPTHEHFHLLHDIAARQLDTRDHALFETHGIPADVANKVHMIITVLPSGTFILT